MTTSIRDISKLTERAQNACSLFLEKCQEQGINIFITETLRTQERQNYLYCQGRTIDQCVAAGITRSFATAHAAPKGHIVTNTLKSNHSTGMAWDIACRGDNLYDLNILNRAGEIANSLGIEWGGNWTTFVDRPHFQINKDWSVQYMVTVKEIEIQLNGITKHVDSVNIDGHNYVKLRDLKDEHIYIGYDKIPIVRCL